MLVIFPSLDQVGETSYVVKRVESCFLNKFHCWQYVSPLSFFHILIHDMDPEIKHDSNFRNFIFIIYS